MRKQVWVGMTVLLLVVVLFVLAACGGPIQGVTPGAGGSQAATPTKETVPTATVAAAPTKEDAPTATVDATETKAATPTQEMAPTATAGATETTAATPTQETASTATVAALDGQALMQARCTLCHNTARIEQAKKDRDGWEETVRRMVGKGAQLTKDEQDALIEYLAKTYPQ
jgi:cytoskeletal protein RodZ